MKRKLLLLAVMLGSMSLFAQTDSVYFFNQGNWPKVFCFAWNDSTGAQTAGAGIQMEITDVTIGDAHMYACAIPSEYNKLFFNDGNTQRAIRETGKNYFVNGQWMTREEMEAMPEPQPAVFDTIFFVNNQGWEQVNCYAWDKYGVNNQDWPGETMQQADYQIKGADVYYYLVDTTKTKCVFNNGNGEQTDDLTWIAGMYYYNGQWVTRAEAEYVAPVVRDTIYFVNDSAWEDLHCYTWRDNEHQEAAWPGEEMQQADYQIKGADVYFYLVDTTMTYCIFNNGKAGDDPEKKQTSDLVWEADKYYFQGQWMTREEAEYVAPIIRDTIYFVNEPAWENVLCYTWSDSLGYEVAWPGDTMLLADYQLQGADVYYYLVDTTLSKCIFNNGNDGNENKTGDLTWEADKYYFHGTWMTREEVEAYTAPVDTIYYVNTTNWENVYCYAWAEGEENAAWPGETMTNTNEQIHNAYIFSYTLPIELTNCIFNDGNDQKTADLEKQAGKYFYNNEWKTLEEISAISTSTSQAQGRSDSEKYMGEDGQVKIRQGENTYDVSGRRE